MRLTLIDLIIAATLGIAGNFFGHIVLGCNSVCAFLFGIIFIVVFASPIYRYFSFRPLWIPICPYCNKRPDKYIIVNARQSLETIACSICSQTTHVIYSSSCTLTQDEQKLKSLTVSWPYFWGRYTQLSNNTELCASAGATESAPAER